MTCRRVVAVVMAFSMGAAGAPPAEAYLKFGIRQNNQNFIVRWNRLPVRYFVASGGVPALEALPGIGESLARSIRTLVETGRLPMLERLRGASDPVALFATVPGIGRRTADRLHHQLGIDTLEELEAAAHDGRLGTLLGLGAKRLAGIRASLAPRLERVRARSDANAPVRPASVGELLDVDREYREKARAGILKTIAPRRLNPAGEAWLPVLHAARGGRLYTAVFSNTPRAHRMGATRDWVVLYCDDGTREQSWTVVTAAFGPLRGRRIVRGRESECAEFYGQPRQ